MFELMGLCISNDIITMMTDDKDYRWHQLNAIKIQSHARTWLQRNTLQYMRHDYYKPGNRGFLTAKQRFYDLC